MRKLSKRISAAAGAAFLAAGGGAAVGIAGAGADAAVTQTSFHMVRSRACLKSGVWGLGYGMVSVRRFAL